METKEQEAAREYRRAVLRELEVRGYSEEDAEKEADVLMGIAKADEQEGDEDGVPWCDTCDSRGRVHKLGCIKRPVK